MNDDLKEALEAIKHLRAALYLAYHERTEVDVNQIDNAMNVGRAVLAKHGESDDMMDGEE